MTTVAGIDLSLTSTGIALVHYDDDQGGFAVDLRRIESKGAKTATLAERHDRLDKLRRDVVLATTYCELVVIEQPAFSRTTGHMHDRSGLWWLVVDWLKNNRAATVVEVAPTARAKYATGKGNAGKDEVLAAVVRRYPTADVTGNDIADALVLAAMGARALGHPIDDMPKAHLDAMVKVAWPQPAGGAA